MFKLFFKRKYPRVATDEKNENNKFNLLTFYSSPKTLYSSLAIAGIVSLKSQVSYWFFYALSCLLSAEFINWFYHEYFLKVILAFVIIYTFSPLLYFILFIFVKLLRYLLLKERKRIETINNADQKAQEAVAMCSSLKKQCATIENTFDEIFSKLDTLSEKIAELKNERFSDILRGA